MPTHLVLARLDNSFMSNDISKFDTIYSSTTGKKNRKKYDTTRNYTAPLKVAALFKAVAALFKAVAALFEAVVALFEAVVAIKAAAQFINHAIISNIGHCKQQRNKYNSNTHCSNK